MRRAISARISIATVTLALAGVVAGCADDPSAAYFSSTPPPVGGPPVAALEVPTVALPTPTPGVSVAMPNPKLTPGVVADSDVVSVCSQPRQPTPALSVGVEDAVLTEYGIPITTLVLASYHFNYLIPLDLGGANAIANIWPISVNKTIGYFQKQQLDGKLRSMVCYSQIQLVPTQQLLAQDWYALYVQYIG